MLPRLLLRPPSRRALLTPPPLPLEPKTLLALRLPLISCGRSQPQLPAHLLAQLFPWERPAVSEFWLALRSPIPQQPRRLPTLVVMLAYGQEPRLLDFLRET